jgi:DNA-binding protein HU-beta
VFPPYPIFQRLFFVFRLRTKYRNRPSGPPDADQEKEIMNKGELVEAIAGETEMSKSGTEAVLNAFVSSVTGALKKGDKVTLTGFGTFSISNRAARMGRNPQTGEAIKVKAAKVPKFKAGVGLKESVN